MSDILCITNRVLCKEDFLTRIDRIAAAHPAGIVLREKDLSPKAYQALAEQVLPICQSHAVPCILHSYPQAANTLGVSAIHLPLPILRELSEQQRKSFRILGASCHSVEDAKEAEALGCTYITAGHVFVTDCKKGVPPRGLAFLRAVCESVRIPVWAIGGIAPDNIGSVLETGAKGGCVMSGLMTCPDPKTLLQSLHPVCTDFSSSRSAHSP